MGLFLIYTGIKIFVGQGEKVEPEKNPLIRLFRRFVPVTSRLRGREVLRQRWHEALRHAALHRAARRREHRRGLRDRLGARDLRITSEPLIVFTSNMFAILGLRTLYFLLANAVDRFHYLKYGLARSSRSSGRRCPSSTTSTSTSRRTSRSAWCWACSRSRSSPHSSSRRRRRRLLPTRPSEHESDARPASPVNRTAGL